LRTISERPQRVMNEVLYEVSTILNGCDQIEPALQQTVPLLLSRLDPDSRNRASGQGRPCPFGQVYGTIAPWPIGGLISALVQRA